MKSFESEMIEITSNVLECRLKHNYPDFAYSARLISQSPQNYYRHFKFPYSFSEELRLPQ
jgi:hypothetical protein